MIQPLARVSRFSRRIMALLVSLSLGLAVSFVWAEEVIDSDHVRIQWLAPDQFAAGGTTETIGLHFDVDPEWHVYWLNPGDSGAEPRFDFSGEGVSVGPPQWPYPQRLPIAHLTNIGYEGDVAYLFDVTPDSNLDTLTLTVDLEWLVCKEDCIPGFGELTLERPIAGSTAEWSRAQQETLARFSARLPQPPETSPWQLTHASLDGRELVLRVSGPDAVSAPQVYPLDGSIVSPAEPEAAATDDGYDLRFNLHPGMPVPETLGFLLVADNAAWEFPRVQVNPDIPTLTETDGTATALWFLLVSAFLGGIILNLMPCVFPVLSIKLFSLIKAPGQGDAQMAHRLREGLLYTAGVLTTFAALGALFLALRAGGAAVGWGFQLQSPAVVMGLALLFWVMALSFVGAFEFGNSVVQLAGKGGSGSSFGTGVLAVFVAAPCTGPFMGAALGASATLPAVQAMAIFIGLGAGLAAPFLLLAVCPALSNRLPRPGPWMETLRQFLAFPLFATVLWLLWVLGRLSGEDGWLIGGILLLVVSFAIWLARSPRRLWKLVALILAAIAIVTSLHSLATLEPGDSQMSSSNSAWQPFNEERIATARNEGQAVFIDYTAAWCITCQVNKSVVLDTREAGDLFSANDVLLIRADWTRYDPAITESLAALGRNSVPVYAFYPAGGEPVELLPQILNMNLLRNLFE